MAEWTGRAATELAAAVRSGEVTAVGVAVGHLVRIARLNPEPGAFARVGAPEATVGAAAVHQRRIVRNLAGYPAAPVPVQGTRLPGAVQLVAAAGRERLLPEAAQIERASGWPRHAPAYATAREEPVIGA